MKTIMSLILMTMTLATYASHPLAPLALTQVNSDGSPLGVGADTTGSDPTSVQIRAASDPSTCDFSVWYRLDLEIQPLNVAFTGVPTHSTGQLPGFKPDCVQKDYPFIVVTGLNSGVGSYHWRVREVTQNGGNGAWAAFNNGAMAFRVAPNLAPTNISLSSLQLAENLPTNSLVGTFTVSDPNSGDLQTLSLVAGVGSDDNSSFSIVGNGLRSNASFDFETKSTYKIRVRTTDNGGLFIEQDFTITIIDVNEPPTGLVAGGPYAIDEGGSLILTASASIDPEGQTVSYSWDVNGDGTFGDAIGQNPTLTWVQLNSVGITDGPSLIGNLRVRATDGINIVTSSATSLIINNVNPVILASVSNPSPDYGDVFTLTGSASDIADDSPLTISWSQVSGPTMLLPTPSSNLVVSLTATSVGSYQFRFRAEDDDGGFSEEDVSVNIQKFAVTITTTFAPTIRLYNTPNPTISATQNPLTLPFGHSLTDVGFAGNFSGIPIDNSPIGIYPISPLVPTPNPNYDITLISSELTISRNQRPRRAVIPVIIPQN